MRLILLVVLILKGVFCQEIPIPIHPDGYLLFPNKYSRHKIELEVYYDLLCPDSAVLHPLILEIGNELDDLVDVKFHIFPLPYHTHSFLFASVIYALPEKEATNWISFSFNIQEHYFNPATVYMSEYEVMQALLHESQSAGYPVDDASFTLGNQKARTGWKLGAERGVFGTPTIFINGVRMPGSSANWNFNRWKSFLTSIADEDRRRIEV